MWIEWTKPLFAWDCLEDSPTLKTLKELLAAIPDQRLLESLRQVRGKGRNDYPVHVLWGVLVLSIACRHQYLESCLDEWRCNAGLRQLIGIESEHRVPSKWNMSRFQETLGTRTPSHALERGVQRDDSAVGGRGTRPWPGHRRRRPPCQCARKPASQAAEEEQEGLPQPSGGRKEYTDDSCKVTHFVEWFGYKLHLQVDVKHEVALSYEITNTKAGDGETLPTLLAQCKPTCLPAASRTSLRQSGRWQRSAPGALRCRHQAGNSNPQFVEGRAGEDAARAQWPQQYRVRRSGHALLLRPREPAHRERCGIRWL